MRAIIVDDEPLMITKFLRLSAGLPGLTVTGLMMMLGGAAGNLADRLLSGYVPDMIEFLFIRFAVFNVADACLVTGCGLVIWNLFRGKENG